MHCGKPDTFVLRFLFRHLKGVFAINKLIVDEFKQRFSESNTNYFVEPNGVDATLFSSRNKMEARQKLNIPQDLKMVLYLGRFFEWKGLEILPKAAEMTPNIEWYIVGGTEEEFYNITERITSSTQIHFMGGCEQAKVPLWFAAADALIVLGTKRDQQSYLYTSPMKLFEYLLSERCIVASDTPAIRQIVSNKEAFLYEPDSAEDLAAKVSEAVLRSPLILEKISKARKKGEIYSWSGRAKRIIKSIQNTLEHD
jgi:glycosyltransferase involved in cell wall biosynthesis